MSDETWIYPASGFDLGERVCIDSEGHPYYDEFGHVVCAEDRAAGIWVVRLDSGEEVEAYSHELTGVTSASSGGGS